MKLNERIAAPYGHERYYSVLPALAWHISRVMLKIETVRERYHYGTKKARLYRDIAVEKRTCRDRLQVVLLLCVLFNSQRTYKPRTGWRARGPKDAPTSPTFAS